MKKTSSALPAPARISAPGPAPESRALGRSALAVALLGAVLALAAALRVDADRASLFGLEGSACLLGHVAGERACPGCGLTRATALAVRGEVGRSFEVHPAGVAVVFLCLAGILVHADVLRRRRRTRGHDVALRAGRWGFVLALAIGWGLRLW